MEDAHRAKSARCRFLTRRSHPDPAIQFPNHGIPMLALLATMLVSAVPYRGTTTIDTIPSSKLLSMRGVSLHQNMVGTLGSCSNEYWWIDEVYRGDSTSYTRFPGDDPRAFQNSKGRQILLHESDYGLNGASCPYGVVRTPSTGFRFLALGASPWVAWNDTVSYTDTSFMGYRLRMKDIRIRWVWSTYDSTRPWVRWADTLDATDGPGAPLLTLTRAVPIDSIVPDAPKDPAETRRLALYIEVDSVRTWTMGYDLAPLRTGPAGAIPSGSNLRLDLRTRSASGSAFLCRVWSGGMVVDSFFLRNPTPVGISQRIVHAKFLRPRGVFDAEGRPGDQAPRSPFAPRFGTAPRSKH